MLVERREVHAPLDPVGKRIERTDHVVSVQAEVESEVVAGAGGDADVGDVMTHGNGGDQCLRTVTSRHPDDIRTPPDGILRELAKVVTGPEQQRLDVALSCLVRQVEASGFPVT